MKKKKNTLKKHTESLKKVIKSEMPKRKKRPKKPAGY